MATACEAPSTLDLFSEAGRLSTFSTWPRSAAVEPVALAKAGFYYLGQADRVRCAFCGGILKNWHSGDNPFTEHTKNYQQCTFIQGIDPRNMPLPMQETYVRAGPTRQMHAQESGKDNSQQFAGVNVPLNLHHPSFQSRDVREASFANWPTNVFQRPHSLADAGFFYSGDGDSVRCFCCDGALRNWERGDDPWEEHARWFPRCPYVLQQKGRAFIQDIVERYRVTQQLLQEQSRPLSPSLSSSIREIYPFTMSEYQRDEDIMRTEAALKALDMGFSDQLILRTLRQLSASLGGHLPSAEILINALVMDNVSGVETLGSGERTTGSCSNTGLPPMHTASGSQVSQGPILGDLDRTLCKICLDREVAVTFLPCGHLVCCFECASHVRECPVCRRVIKANIRTFLA